ncbi:hypothetical protein [Streptomyces griseosporeus]|uniref:hypothetical protein n=1 Tax=Streptomyces griseosporeus TaxID=1910 RepID=UPI0037B28836
MAERGRHLPPPPDHTWVVGSLAVALEEGGGPGLGYRRAGACLEYDDGSGTHWQLVRLAGGRAVVTGFDVDYSEERDPAELLAGAPGWLPRDWSGLTERIAFCYWWEHGADEWSYASCPPDRGAKVTGSPYDVEERLFERVWERVGDDGEVAREFTPQLDALLDAAFEGRVGEDGLGAVLQWLEDARYVRPAAALAAAEGAGLTPGSRRPELPVTA